MSDETLVSVSKSKFGRSIRASDTVISIFQEQTVFKKRCFLNQQQKTKSSE